MEPDKVVENSQLKRDENGKLLPGTASLNPNGRPKGKTLKEFARGMLMSMDEDEKRAYLKELPKDIVWRMSEGNPHQTTDVQGEITVANPLLHAIRHNNSNKEISGDGEADQGGAGGNSSG